ncbi:MAG: AAA family ATPase [Chitinophagaceae bacterium]
MELVERSGFLDSLRRQFIQTSTGEGHTVFVSGEAGIGKTSLLRAFCAEHQNDCVIYQGACDALFTPRPLAPLFDIGWQIRDDFWDKNESAEDRPALFSRFFHELNNQKKPIVLLFEDIHWADEATLDFIKFLARRITRLHCLFILTYRDNEIHSNHPLKSVLGQLPPDSFTRLQLIPLSKHAVDRMAAERGYRGEDVYTISGGNPFYVTEILASYSSGIPDNIKDAVLSVYNRQPAKTKEIWELLSVVPAGLETCHLEEAEPDFEQAIENNLDAKILILDKGTVFFKHELYRRTLEKSMSPFRRMALNKKMLEVLLGYTDKSGIIERIIHHAKNANDYDCVVKYAPDAAVKAACVGAHIEAAKLYFTAIEYYQGKDKDLLTQLYASYSYECYLINRMRDAIIYQGKLLAILREGNDLEKIGDCLRFLSRLWWFEGNRGNAENYASQAIALLENQPVSRVKAMAYSNMSHLKMLSDELEECLHWSEKTIAMAKELNDDAILSHVLNNAGSVQMKTQNLREKGAALLKESLDIALRNSFHEHAARAYTNIGSDLTIRREYSEAEKILNEGIHYCEERELDAWTKYMLTCKARLKLETGEWNEALAIADRVLQDEQQAGINKHNASTVMAMIAMRRGEEDVATALMAAKTRAFTAGEHQRIVPVAIALLEYEWITGRKLLDDESLAITTKLVETTDNTFHNCEFGFWLSMVRNKKIIIKNLFEGYDISGKAAIDKAAAIWRKLGCPYEEALVLYHGDDEDKKQAVEIIQQLGATAVYNKMKEEMKQSGIKNIPRGIRSSTKSNPAFLTTRELDILELLKENLQNKEIGSRLFISAKTVDHHISSILFKLDVNSRNKAVSEAQRRGILK